MILVPTVIPVTVPPLKETLPLLLLHVPPPVPSDKEVVEPTHTVRVPLMAVGNALTVNTAVIIQPVGKV